MKVAIAIDSFKGSMSSLELADAVNKGIKSVFPESEIIKFPIADGGEGTVDSLVTGTEGRIIKTKVNDPLMREIESRYGILGDGKTAVIEMAEASGLPLLRVDERNPLKTTTFGTGQLIKDAISKDCRTFIIGVGGSATNDAGIGMLQALGYQFFDENGDEVGYGGENLSLIKTIDSSKKLVELDQCSFLIACDVDNPFYGPTGAAEIYSRQKGATEKMVEILDQGLRDLSSLIKKELNKDISKIPGSGAAGGLGGGLMAFLNGELKSGIKIVIEKLEMEKKIKDCDFVITGEGRLDSQTAMGKAPVGISEIAKKFNIPVIAIAGGVSDDAYKLHQKGIDCFFSIMNYPITLEEAMKKEKATELVIKNTEEIFRLIKICSEKFSK